MVSAFLAAVTGVLVAPGLRGLAPDRVVNATNLLARTFAYFLGGSLIVAVVVAAMELSNKSVSRSAWNGLQVSAAGLVVAIASPSLVQPLPTILSAALAVVASLAVFAGGLRGLRASHTRAVAVVMLSFGAAGLLRIAGWDLARVAGESGNTTQYALARGVATVAVVCEAVGQMVAAAWLGTRSRLAGQVLSSLAIGLAWVLTASAAHGASVSASPWEVAAHIALASAIGLPEPYKLGGLAVFLLAGSILLSGVAAAQRGQVVAVVAALGLSLLGRGAFDVPLHALAATAAAMWLTVAVTDDRAMWQSLLASRGARGVRPAGPGGPAGSGAAVGGTRPGS